MSGNYTQFHLVRLTRDPHSFLISHIISSFPSLVSSASLTMLVTIYSSEVRSALSDLDTRILLVMQVSFMTADFLATQLILQALWPLKQV